MALDHDAASVRAQSTTRVFIGFTSVGPIGDLVSVNPNRDMVVAGDDRFVKPMFILSDNTSGILATEDATGATIGGCGWVIILHAILNLTLVSHHLGAGDAAKEDSGIETIKVTDAFEL